MRRRLSALARETQAGWAMVLSVNAKSATERSLSDDIHCSVWKLERALKRHCPRLTSRLTRCFWGGEKGAVGAFFIAVGILKGRRQSTGVSGSPRTAAC